MSCGESSTRFRLLVGLGNPGLRYRRTRHNVGFRVLDRLAARHGATFAGAPRGSQGLYRRVELVLGGMPIAAIQPRTFMNRSGAAVAAALRETDGDVSELVVIHDDADLELGRLRVRPGGGAGGHNGVRSLIDTLGRTGFARIRVGVRGTGRDDGELADYVLAPFDEAERDLLLPTLERAADAVECLVLHGVDVAMNEFNGAGLGSEGQDREV